MGRLVERKKNLIELSDIRKPEIVGELISVLNRVILKQNFEDVYLDLGNLSSTFPNVAVPISAVIDYFKVELNIDFYFKHLSEFVESTNLSNPKSVSEKRPKEQLFNSIWKFESATETEELVTAYVNEISRTIVCEEGLIDGLTWCLNEVMDNVLQHSNLDRGFAMAQIHTKLQHIAI